MGTNEIRAEVDPNANIILGSTFDETLEGSMRVSVVATGIDDEAIVSQQTVVEPARRAADGPMRRPYVSKRPEPAPAPAPPAPSADSPPESGPARPEPVARRAPAPISQAKVLASPAVRARAKELGIDLAEVRPAEDGRVRHSDLDAFLSYGGAQGYAPAGHAGGRLKGGVHLEAANGTPLSNVMLSLLHALGLDDLHSFGDSEGAFSWE